VGLRCYSLAAGKGVMARCEILSSGGFAGGVTLDVMVAEGQLMELMIAYQAGDLGAFERLYAILAGEVIRYFSRLNRARSVVNDLVQDLFLEVHRSRRTYTAPLPVRPWIFGIARNVSARNRRALRLEPESNDFDPAVSPSDADALDIQSALTALPASTREPWLLHHLFGFSFDSIAARLGITVMAAKLRSSRATRALRLALQLNGKPSQ
jgi:RNA polymerase sigma-70 factor (ECF subfamily)